MRRSDDTTRARSLADASVDPTEARNTPIRTVPRGRRERPKATIVRERRSEAIHTLEGMAAEFAYGPTACERDHRLIVLRKRLAREKGQMRLLEEYGYAFFITNDGAVPADQVVLSVNGRCDQGNLGSRPKTGVPALTAPVDDVVRNRAYVVMAGLACTQV